MKKYIQNSGVKQMSHFKIKPINIMLAALFASPMAAQATNYGKYDVLDGTFFMAGVTGAPIAIANVNAANNVLIDSTYKSTGVFQGPTPTPPYPNNPADETVRNNTDVLDPFLFFGSNVGTYTAAAGADTDGIPFVAGDGTVIPDVSTDPHTFTSVDLNAGTANMEAFYAYWNGNEFNQGHNAAVVSDNGDGSYNVEWSSLIIGGPFHNFTGTWTMNIQCATGYICTNTAPVAQDDTITTDFNTPSAAFNLTTNDTDADTHTGSAVDASTVLITGATGAGTGSQTLVLTNGTVVLTEVTGTVVYTPNTGATGSDSFTYTVQDELGQATENDFGASSNAATVTITVNPDGTPNAVSDSATTPFATTVDIDVDANDVVNTALGAANLAPGTIAVISDVSNGSTEVITPKVDGIVRYIPNGSFFGTDSFTYTIEDNLGTPSNSATVTITVGSPPRTAPPTDKAVGPTPEVTVAQGGNTNARTITKDGGNVTVSVDTSSGLYDLYNWTGTSIEIVGDQSITPPTLGGLTAHWVETSSSIAFDPSGLTVGNHNIKVQAWDTGTSPSASVTLNFAIEVLATGTLSDYADSDNDGIIDSADTLIDNVATPTLVLANSVGGTNYIMESDSGKLTIGTSAKCAGNNGAVISLTDFSEIDASNNCVALTNTADISNAVQTGIGGYFDFEVRGLAPASTVNIAIPLSTTLPKNAGYRKFVNSWQAFDTTGADSIASANATTAGTCPAPTSTSAWTNGLTEGHNCILLTITDGGSNDADGIANGVVIDPGTIVGYEGIGTDVTVGGGWWFLMSGPALFGLRRFTKKK